MANELEPRPEQAATTVKDLIPVSERGLVLRSLDDMFRFAQYLAQTRLTPKGLDTPSQILLAIQMGSELGLPPMASIQNIAVINGRPSIWGDAALAVCMEHPNYLDHDEEFDDATMTATFKVYTKKRGMERPITRTFSMSDAKTAQLQGKAGPWTQYPKRMLQLRARGFGLRDAFPGALRGLLTTEEVRDLPPRQVENENETSPPTTGKMAKLHARGPIKPAEPATEAAVRPVVVSEPTEPNEPPFDPDPPLDAPYAPTEGREPGSDDDAGVDEEPFSEEGSPITPEQKERIVALKAEKKVAPRQFANILVDAGSEDAQVDTLTTEQADAVIAALGKLKS